MVSSLNLLDWFCFECLEVGVGLFYFVFRSLIVIISFFVD